MSLNIKFEDMPQLVLLSVTSFLSHKELLAMERVSSKLKWIVDAYFSTTNHLIIGTLPEITVHDPGKYQDMSKKTDSLNGLLKVITRCGTRLKTIQINVTDRLHFDPAYILYFNHLLGSGKMCVKCPNVQSIITSPKMVTFETDILFDQQRVALSLNSTATYASQVRLSANDACKLRSIRLYFKQTSEEQQFNGILFVYPHLEQIALYGNHNNFLKYLSKFIDNGLKDLLIVDAMSIENARKLCNIGMNLRTLSFTIQVKSDNDILSLNRIRLSKNVKLKIEIWSNECLELMNDDVCNAIIVCALFGSPSDYSLMSRLKNLEEFQINDSEELKVIAEHPFPKLQRIRNPVLLCSCDTSYTCELNTFLPALLVNKGKQFTLIEILHVCCSLDVVWWALKHCTAAISIEFFHVEVNSTTTLTYDDVIAIFNLPKIQKLKFSTIMEGEDFCGQLRELLERAAQENGLFKFEYKEVAVNGNCYVIKQEFLLNRIVN